LSAHINVYLFIFLWPIKYNLNVLKLGALSDSALIGLWSRSMLFPIVTTIGFLNLPEDMAFSESFTKKVYDERGNYDNIIEERKPPILNGFVKNEQMLDFQIKIMVVCNKGIMRLIYGEKV